MPMAINQLAGLRRGPRNLRAGRSMGTSSTNRQPQAAARAAYLVLGMHRSGTSAITQLLALAGATLPQNVMPGDAHNAKGYFEPWKVALFDDERLRAAGSAWDDPFAFPFRPLPAAQERRWKARAASVLAEEYGAAQWPLIKDPRVTVLLPLWREVLSKAGLTVRCVIPVRHPMAVAGSLRRRDEFVEQKSVLIWTAYMLAAEAYTRDLPRAFVNYDALLADWRGEVRTIETAHNARLPRLTPRAAAGIDAFLTPELRHNAGEGALTELGWTGELAQTVFDALSGSQPDTAALDAAAAELAAWKVKIGALVSPAARDLDARRADLAEATRRAEVAEALQIHQREVLESGWRKDVGDLRSVLGQLSAELDNALLDE
jgi:hypothetical protein